MNALKEQFKKWSTWTALLIVIIANSSCNKISNYSEIELLVGKKWTLVSVKENSTEKIKDCEKDDYILFQKSGIFSFSTGSDLCENQMERENSENKWRFREGYSIIKMIVKINEQGQKGNVVERWRIEEIQDSKLILKEEREDKEIIKEYSN